tara:strand:+ start:6619 stop:7566 length:948 start_codon:yes stop_codon:yes gene_type:complete
MTKLEDCVEKGVGVDGIYGLSDVVIVEDRNGNPYLKGKVVDATGELPIQMFSDSQTTHLVWEKLEKGRMVGVKGIVDDYKGWLHVKVAALDPDPPVSANADPRPIVPQETMHEARGVISKCLGKIEHESLKSIVKWVNTWFDEGFYESPGFSDAHIFQGSLATHTADLMTAIENMADPFYQEEEEHLLYIAALVTNLYCAAGYWDIGGFAPIVTLKGVISNPASTSMQIFSGLAKAADLEPSVRLVLEDCIQSVLDRTHTPRTEEGVIFKNVHSTVTQIGLVAFTSRKTKSDSTYILHGNTMFQYAYPKEDGWSA